MADPAVSRESLRPSWARLGLAAALAGLLGGLVTLWVGYRVAGGVPVPEQAAIRWTRLDLMTLREQVESFRQTTGALPADLQELANAVDEKDPDAVWVPEQDRWQNPLVYRTTGPDTYEVYSLGRDGQTGGVGADTDFRGDDPHEGRLGIIDFLVAPGSGNLGWSAIGAGLLFALIVVVESRKQPAAEAKPHQSAGWLSTTLYVIAIIGAAVVVGFVMAFHHAIQHGH